MAGTKAPITDMRPTQLTLGLAEVEERAKKIAAMTPAEREAHLAHKAVPHVLGPGKKVYIVDHHHLARALWSLKIPEAVLGDRVADWSSLEPKAFWRMMESKGYCWPIDAEGNRRPYAAIPASIGDLTDNVWRTLARRVRGAASSTGVAGAGGRREASRSLRWMAARSSSASRRSGSACPIGSSASSARHAVVARSLSTTLSVNKMPSFCSSATFFDVSATLDAFALTLLGEDDVAVYDGSMAEWISDPERPLEQG